MPDYRGSDGWQALRTRLERRPERRRRRGWVPERVLPPAGDDADARGAESPGASASPQLAPAHLAVVALVTVAALLGTVVVILGSQPERQVVPVTPQPEPTLEVAAADAPGVELMATASTNPSASSVPAQQPPAEVVVHVAGKVRRPGVVRLPVGARVVDAVDAAGGVRRGADLSTVNLARVLVDGEQVLVGLDTRAAMPGTSTTSAPSGAGAEVASVPLDLNLATEADLDTLPGIGPVLAARIVAYREQSGPFQSVDQLLEVSGVGPAVLGGLEGLIRV